MSHARVCVDGTDGYKIVSKKLPKSDWGFFFSILLVSFHFILSDLVTQEAIL